MKSKYIVLSGITIVAAVIVIAVTSTATAVNRSAITASPDASCVGCGGFTTIVNGDGSINVFMFTAVPALTDTPLPTATDTAVPTATPTNTAVPPTDTPDPPTSTPLSPTATDTTVPTPTDTPQPTATSTPLPTDTPTPAPTETVVPTPTTIPGQPYPASSVITSVDFDAAYETLAPGSDNWPVTWSDDGNQYTSWGDGGGFGGTNVDGRVSLGIARVEGDPTNYVGINVWGGKDAENPAQFNGKSYGIISIEGILYMWRSPRQSSYNYDEARLAYSTDHGATWTLNDWAFYKADDLILPTILNFGQDYAGARDNYVYSYAPRYQGATSLAVQVPGLVDLMRVPKTQILERSGYEFFAGMVDGQPTWTTELTQRQPVFEDANGVGWNLSASHNAGLNRYLLMTEHEQTGYGNLGIFDAPEPWGPWTTVAYYDDWLNSRTFFWNFSNKWLSADGRDFWMVFSGVSSFDSWNLIHGTFEAP